MPCTHPVARVDAARTLDRNPVPDQLKSVLAIPRTGSDHRQPPPIVPSPIHGDPSSPTSLRPMSEHPARAPIIGIPHPSYHRHQPSAIYPASLRPTSEHPACAPIVGIPRPSYLAVDRTCARRPSLSTADPTPRALRLCLRRSPSNQGCDASVLISGASAERSTIQNTGLRGFEVVDNAKSQLEALCPGVVSCADILALAARDAVHLTHGPSWSVPLGRRDGRISSGSEVTSLPSPANSVAVQRQKFSDKGLNDHDLVTLVGAHTIGQTDCAFFRYRLYNFTATGNPDPTINPKFLAQLQAMCPQNGDASKRVALDKDSMTKFDQTYFKNVRDGNGVLESDQRLWGDADLQVVVKNYAGTFRGLLGLRFSYDFSKAMIKMGGIGVKTGAQGEIRKICSKLN